MSEREPLSGSEIHGYCRFLVEAHLEDGVEFLAIHEMASSYFTFGNEPDFVLTDDEAERVRDEVSYLLWVLRKTLFRLER